jgi:hypothetical protein
VALAGFAELAAATREAMGRNAGALAVAELAARFGG